MTRTASVPRQIRNCNEGGDQVEDGPGDDDAVVDVQEENDNHRRDSDTCEKCNFATFGAITGPSEL